MPSKYGSYVTAWKILKRLQEAGVWDRILSFLAGSRGSGSVAVDSSTVEAKRGVR